jgi:two-component system sensor histidine kinase RegB
VIWLGWLVRLRFVAMFAQLFTLSFTWRVLDRPQTTVPVLFCVIAILGFANVLALPRLNRGGAVPQAALLGHLALDVVALTAFFALAGGETNPFTILYVIHVAMGAVILEGRLAAALSALVLLCYCLILAFHLPLLLDRQPIPVAIVERVGQLVAFAIAVVSVASFVVGLARSMRDHKQRLLEARMRTARFDRLRAVGTLAAGAAHEINTPLGTIGLRIRRIGRRYSDGPTTDDLAVIATQLGRCKRVVEQLLVGAGDPSASSIEPRRVGEMVREAVALWRKGASVGLDLRDESNDVEIEVPVIAFGQALINLLENAREAQEEIGAPSAIELVVSEESGLAVVTVSDRGVGLPPESEHMGDPFFTTKDTGTGLGVFVARALADGAGGGLSYAQRPDGRGTVARWWFPSRARTPPAGNETPA